MPTTASCTLPDMPMNNSEVLLNSVTHLDRTAADVVRTRP
jgi:hypothetical protein